MDSSDDDKPARINLDEVMRARPGGKVPPEPPTTEELISKIERDLSFLPFAAGLLVGWTVLSPLAEKLLSEQADKKSNPELPVSSPVLPQCAGHLSQGRNDFEHLVAAPINDQHIPKALLSGSEYPHSANRTPN
jgi:hypothetical protein